MTGTAATVTVATGRPTVISLTLADRDHDHAAIHLALELMTVTRGSSILTILALALAGDSERTTLSMWSNTRPPLRIHAQAVWRETEEMRDGHSSP